MVKVRKLKDVEDIIHYTKLFNRAIGYSNVPWRYHATGTTYALYDSKNRIVGGFVLIPGYWHLRTILQMPEEVQKSFYKDNPKIVQSLCDLTGYFIINPKHGLKITIKLLLTTLFSKYRYFCYSYPIHDVALKKYYGTGKPILLYAGVPRKLEGHSDHMDEEYVEILTKIGIVRIFLYRTTRMLLNYCRAFFQH